MTDGLMDNLSVQHLAWLDRQGTKARNTALGRARVLRTVDNAGTITREQLETWWESRAHLAPATRASDLAHLRAFFRWAAVYEHRLDDPTVRIEAPRVSNRIPKRARASDMKTLLDGDLPSDLKRAFMLGGYAGLRVSEAAALDWADVDDDDSTITIRESKGGKSRVIPVSPMLIDWLGERTTGNVVTGGGTPYTASALQQRLNRAIKRAGLDITTHSLRHRWGMTAYQSSGDLLAVAEMMGHSSINTTKVYAEASSDVKRKIASAVMR
jgi:integrase